MLQSTGSQRIGHDWATGKQIKLHRDEAQGVFPFLVASRVPSFLLLLKLDPWWAFTSSPRSSLVASLSGPLGWVHAVASLVSTYSCHPSRGVSHPLWADTPPRSLSDVPLGGPHRVLPPTVPKARWAFFPLTSSQISMLLCGPHQSSAQDWKQETSDIRDLFFLLQLSNSIVSTIFLS